MPAKGGASGKLGDQYEALWAVDAALRVAHGSAEYVTYESLDPEESRGVEFNVQTEGAEIEFWSVKRQTTTAAGWTLATLVKPDEHGRSILGDLRAHLERVPRTLAVFASALGAPRLEELRSVAATAQTLQQRLKHSAELKKDYDKYLLALFDGNEEDTRHFLTRLQIRTADQSSLRTNIESTISLLFYSTKGDSVNASAIRRLLAEYLLDHMHRKIDREMLLNHLAAHGYRRRDWTVDTTIRDKVNALCDAYTRPLREQLIGGTLQTLPGAGKILGPDSPPIARRTLISGGAGGGKSSELAHAVERLRAARVPVLPIRMDVVTEDVLTPQRLGEALSLPASPVTVLAGLADGGDCVLVVDQLDAVSLASGRRVDLWSLFEQLLAEADQYQNLRVIVACREFDLEHDHRMRSLKAKTSAFEVVTIGSFDAKTVDDILGDRKVHPKLRPLLTVPLHLAMFLALDSGESENLETRDQLFDAFWTEKRRRCTQRLDRECKFAKVVDWLSKWLSDHQELSAPANMLPDELRADADTLASEHVIVLADRRYRFFHETFFDYAFARRFAQTGKRLLDLLLSTEQHLFRRAQVRQVLSFLRSNDPSRYAEEIRSLLTHDRIRFHIKEVVFQYLSAIDAPTPAEWTVLRELEAAQPMWRGHVNRVVANRVGWFDRLDAAGFLESALSIAERQKEERIIWLCAMPQVLEQRSHRAASLLLKYRRNDDAWRQYLRYVCRNGNAFYSRQMFRLFLSLIVDGTLDGLQPGFALNDNWWNTLYSMAEKAPAMAAEAIAVWFDRKLAVWERTRPVQAPSRQDSVRSERGNDNDEKSASTATLREHLDEDGQDWDVIVMAARGAPLAFVEQLLPRVAALVEKHAVPRRDRFDSDPLWSFRVYGDSDHQVHGLLFKGLAIALESLACSAPTDLDRLLAPYVEYPHDAIAYLILRAWTAAPNHYAERLARYLATDPRRLKVGYTSCGGGAGTGTISSYRSIEAVRVASQTCSPEAFGALEAAVVSLRDEWESRHPQLRGLGQLQHLAAMDQSRLGPSGRVKLSELQTKFPEVTYERPQPIIAVSVGPPIPTDAQEKMTDDQWLSAMEKYAGVEHVHGRALEASGGEYQLAQSLESKTKANAKRFVGLAMKVPSSLPASYFEAILRGVAETPPPERSSANDLALSDVIALIKRVHELPGRPCGRWINHLVEKWAKIDWPSAIIDIVAWYAAEDPDPADEPWRKRASGGQLYYRGDPDFAGMNSTRGSAANAIAALLFAEHPLTDRILNAVEHLAHDPSIAVRSQAVQALLALLNTRSDLAIPWFVECVSADDILLQTRLVEHFVYYAGRRDYAAIRCVLRKMLSSDDGETVQAAAKLCCLLALKVEAADEDAAQVRTGTQGMREAAAAVYAANAASKVVGQQCRQLLLPFFADPVDEVRAAAATAFRHIAALETSEQAQLLKAFLDGNPNAAALKPVIRALEDSPIRLPDLVCRLVEAGIEQFKADAGDVRTHSSLVARDLSKIVVRLYTQSDDEAIRKRCLDAIDQMEQASFWGLKDELENAER